MQGFNKYYPPDWEPSDGSLNTYHGKHALGQRASKIKDGILVIRFECPWHIFCNHCNAHIAKGARWNAEKSQDGAYHSTKIWKFAMTCHVCSGPIVMRTDPQHRDYAIVSGATRKTMDYDAQDANVIDLPDDKHKRRMVDDPLFMLEHKAKDQEAGREQKDDLDALLAVRDEQYDNDYRASRLVRGQFRKRKADEIATEQRNRARGIYVPLLPEDPRDVQVASRTKFAAPRIARKPQSIFGGPKKRKE